MGDVREIGMSHSVRAPDGGPGWERVMRYGLLALVGVAAALHLPVIVRTAVQWDEFRFLADIHTSQRGALTAAFQRFHVHLFGWVTSVGANEVDQVIAARSAYFALLLGSCAFVYLIGRRFLAQTAAMFVVLCYLSFREVLVSGTSFRYDGLSVFFLLGAMALLMRRGSRAGSLVAAASATALALLVTVKSIFYLPTLAAVVLLRNRSSTFRGRLRDLTIFGVTMAGAFLVGFLFHRHGLAPGAVAESVGVMQQAGQRVISLAVLFPARDHLVAALLLNAMIWLFLGFGLVSLLWRLRDRSTRRESLLALSLLLPLLSLLFYRNAFTYYYVFLMPGVLVVAGIRFDEVLDRAARERSASALGFLCLMIAGLVLTLSVNYTHVLRHPTVAGGRMIDAQRQVIEVVHRIFPEPVPYIDAGSMISSFPKHGFFMSSWGFANYLEAGTPVFRGILTDHMPEFLLANQSGLLVHDPVPSDTAANPERLLEEDRRILRDNYVPHWGPLFVAGKQIQALDSGEQLTLEILIPGTYTIEAEDHVVVNGARYDPGGQVDLDRGLYDIAAPAGGQAVVLRWGVNLYRPAHEPIPLPELQRARPVLDEGS